MWSCLQTMKPSLERVIPETLLTCHASACDARTFAALVPDQWDEASKLRCYPVIERGDTHGVLTTLQQPSGVVQCRAF